MLKPALTVPSTRLAEIVDGDVPLEALAWQLDHFKEQRKRNRVFFVPPIRGVWVRRLAELIEPRLEARAGTRPAPLLPWSFVATQLAENQMALISNWLALRLATPSEAVAAAMIAMTRATIDAMAPIDPGLGK